MAAKLPVIAAHNDGPAEILANGKYGFLFKNGNARDLANKIFNAIKLLEQTYLEDMIEDAHQHCMKNYDVKNTASKYVDDPTRVHLHNFFGTSHVDIFYHPHITLGYVESRDFRLPVTNTGLGFPYTFDRVFVSKMNKEGLWDDVASFPLGGKI